MIEICIFVLFLYFKKLQKKIYKWPVRKTYNWSWYKPPKIRVDDIHNVVEVAKKSCFVPAMTAYIQVLELLEEKTVIQIQMYGLGSIYTKRENGPIQLGIALRLAEKFKAKFSDLSLTFQEPIMKDVEKDYLMQNNITVFDGKEFKATRCHEAFAKAIGVSKPVIICYLMFLPYWAIENFFHAHWDPLLLSQLIIITPPLSGRKYLGLKTYNYYKWAEVMPITCDLNAVSPEEYERRNSYAFSRIKIYTISYENAKYLTDYCRY